MPKTTKKSESNIEFQKRTFPDRIKVQREKNEKVLRIARGGLGPVSDKQKAIARKSEAALDRVEKRLNIKSKEVVRSSKKPTSPRERGGGAIRELLKRPTKKTQKGLDAVLRKSKG